MWKDDNKFKPNIVNKSQKHKKISALLLNIIYFLKSEERKYVIKIFKSSK